MKLNVALCAIAKNENLYIISVESPNKDENTVTNKLNYKIFLKNGTQLTNFSACENHPK